MKQVKKTEKNRVQKKGSYHKEKETQLELSLEWRRWMYIFAKPCTFSRAKR
jgi:hypothetical protein